jgi:ABC-type multidrug transport system ATPase subunit
LYSHRLNVHQLCADTIKGATGAGKTTLLNVLADRAGKGVVSGYIGVSDQYSVKTFAQKIDYAQQQDLHLFSATVREALEFSALLRQSSQYSRVEKLVYVKTVIELLDMGKFVDAMIGVFGEGNMISSQRSEQKSAQLTSEKVSTSGNESF